jgi:hypothetical protein
LTAIALRLWVLVRDAEGSMRYRMYRKGGPKFVELITITLRSNQMHYFVELIMVSNSYGILYFGDDDLLDVSTHLPDYTVS